MQRRLGKRPPKHDKRTLRFAKYLIASQLPPPPVSVDWTASVAQPWGDMLNQQIGCCTIAAVGHSIQTWTANNGNEITITDQDVLNAYIAVTSQEGAAYNPQTGQNDNGAVELDVLNYWRNSGIGGHKIGAYAAILPTSQQEIMEAIWLFGVCYIGLSLPLEAQQLVDQNQPWDVPSSIGFLQRNLWQPGGWGGHAVCLVEADQYGPTCITWGAKQKISWAFMNAYCEEAYALLSEDWVIGAKPAPNSFDMNTLSQDLQQITKS